jgi:hypothetical protein
MRSTTFLPSAKEYQLSGCELTLAFLVGSMRLLMAAAQALESLLAVEAFCSRSSASPHFGQDGLCAVLGMAVHPPTISRALPPCYGEIPAVRIRAVRLT